MVIFALMVLVGTNNNLKFSQQLMSHFGKSQHELWYSVLIKFMDGECKPT